MERKLEFLSVATKDRIAVCKKQLKHYDRRTAYVEADNNKLEEAVQQLEVSLKQRQGVISLKGKFIKLIE